MINEEIKIIEQLIAGKKYVFDTTSKEDKVKGSASSSAEIVYPNPLIVQQEPLESILAPYRELYDLEVKVTDFDQYTAMFSRAEKCYRFSFLAYSDNSFASLMEVGFRVNILLIGTSGHSQDGTHFLADGVIGWKKYQQDNGYGTLHVCPNRVHLNNDETPYAISTAEVQAMIKLMDFSPLGKYSRLLKEGLQFLCGIPFYYHYYPELKLTELK